MSFSQGVSSAPWTPNSSWPHSFVAGSGVTINNWQISSTGGGGGGTTQPLESFAVTLAADWTYVDPGAGESITVTNWTDVPDPVSFPDSAPNNTIFNNASSGLDLATGIYTAPFAGTYAFYLTRNGNIFISINATGPNLNPHGIAYTDKGIIELAVGDTVCVQAYASVLKDTFISGDPNNYPNLVWSMFYLSGVPGVPGATGPQGPVGPAGPQGTATPESFSVILSGNYSPPGINNYEQVAPYTDVPNGTTFDFGSIDKIVYNTTSAGLDLVAGTYTAPFEGVYRVTIGVFQPWASLGNGPPALCVNKTLPSDTDENVISNYSQNRDLDVFLNLSVGDVVSLALSSAIPETVTDSTLVYPPFFWQMTFISGVPGVAGPPGPAGPSKEIEGFGVILSATYTNTSGGDYERLANWTATLNPVDFPQVDPQICFNSITAGSGTLDLTAGTYTVASNGLYQVSLWYYSNVINCVVTRQTVFPSATSPVEIFQKTLDAVDGTGFSITELIYLQAGDVVSVASNATVPYSTPFAAPTSYDAPAVKWSMVNLSGAPVQNGLGEIFSITLASNFTYAGLFDYELVPDWTDTIPADPAYSTVPSGLVFSDVNYGTLNLAAGTYTIGRTGFYRYDFYWFTDGSITDTELAGICVNYVDDANPGLIQTTNVGTWKLQPIVSSTGTIYLTVGDVVTVRSHWDMFVGSGGALANTGGFPILWGMEFLR